VRLLPSAKVCFLGGCPRSGRNQNLFRRDSEAEDRRAAGRSLFVARGALERWEKKGSGDRQVWLGGRRKTSENHTTRRTKPGLSR
jgi:hypothetical protein